MEGIFYIASVRGIEADWYRNLVTCPKVDVQVGNRSFSTIARPILDVKAIADFLELRVKRHPRFMGIMLLLEGLPRKHTRVDLEKFAQRLVIVALHEKLQYSNETANQV